MCHLGDVLICNVFAFHNANNNVLEALSFNEKFHCLENTFTSEIKKVHFYNVSTFA